MLLGLARKAKAPLSESFSIIQCFSKSLVYNAQVVLQETVTKIIKSYPGSKSLPLHLLNFVRKNPSILTNSFLFKALLPQHHHINL